MCVGGLCVCWLVGVSVLNLQEREAVLGIGFNEFLPLALRFSDAAEVVALLVALAIPLVRVGVEPWLLASVLWKQPEASDKGHLAASPRNVDGVPVTGGHKGLARDFFGFAANVVPKVLCANVLYSVVSVYPIDFPVPLAVARPVAIIANQLNACEIVRVLI